MAACLETSVSVCSTLDFWGAPLHLSLLRFSRRLNFAADDSMADGVSGSAVVLCCVSPAYQDSANCKLELQFAQVGCRIATGCFGLTVPGQKPAYDNLSVARLVVDRLGGVAIAQQTGIAVVPAMMTDPDTFKASGWLGLILAGLLWTPLFEASTFESNVNDLVEQIKQAVPELTIDSPDSPAAVATTPGITDEGEGELFTLNEMRAELERLRRQAAPARRQMTRAGDDLCILPAAVPELPPGGVRVTSEMRMLVELVTSPSSRTRIGFHGIGGSCFVTLSPAPLCIRANQPCVLCARARVADTD
jgi:hypothetical protein